MFPNATYNVISDAYHYSFFPICTEDAPQFLLEEGEDLIFDDPEDWNRSTAHEASILAIAQFLEL